jgi:hypothetical protein
MSSWMSECGGLCAKDRLCFSPALCAFHKRPIQKSKRHIHARFSTATCWIGGGRKTRTMLSLIPRASAPRLRKRLHVGQLLQHKLPHDESGLLQPRVITKKLCARCSLQFFFCGSVESPTVSFNSVAVSARAALTF